MQYADNTDQSSDGSGDDVTMAELMGESTHTLRSVKRGDVVDGVVVAIDRDEILVDIGLKSEAVLPLKELFSSGYGSLEEIHYNDHILVSIVQPETSEGHAIVSVRKARTERQWRVAQEMFERGDIFDAKAIESNKGGLIVDLDGVRGFVPISQIAAFRREDSSENAETIAKLQAMVGKSLKLKIIEINRSRNRLILSERIAMQEWRQHRREELLEQLQIGDVLTGVVSNFAPFGAFVDLGGADGLVHISQLSWTRVNHPSEVLHVGQEVEVQVVNIDKDRKKIGLSIRRPDTDPWKTIEERYQIGQVVTATITKIATFGAFARLEPGVEGLIHSSEIDPPTNDPKAVLREGQEVQVSVLRIESDRRRLGLSMRAAHTMDPAAAAMSADALDAAYAQAPDATFLAPEAPRPAAAPKPEAPRRAPAPPPAAATTAFGAAFDEALRRQNSVAESHTPATEEPVAKGAAPEPSVADAPPVEVAKDAAPEPSVVDAPPVEATKDAAPEPSVADAPPVDAAKDAAPEPSVADAPPVEVAKDAAPEPSVADAPPVEVAKDAAPEPSVADAPPVEAAKDAAPEPSVADAPPVDAISEQLESEV